MHTRTNYVCNYVVTMHTSHKKNNYVYIAITYSFWGLKTNNNVYNSYGVGMAIY